MIKEVIFFSIGDSTKASTWSNVPYLFCKEIENRGIIARRIDLEDKSSFKYLFNRVIYKLSKKTTYYYERSWIFRIKALMKIKKAVKKYNKADICIFCTYGFYNKYSNIPSLLFCDWSYSILLKDRYHKKPNFLEKTYVSRENRAILSSQIVISLFPECALKMKRELPNANIYYLGSNVVNSFYNGIIDEKEIISTKKKYNNILFIGNQNNPSYLETARLIANAVKSLKGTIKNLQYNVIGINQSKLEIEDENIFCYGYLRKDNPKELALYYKLLLSSSLIVNVSPIWAGYSSLIEAMYYYTPVLVSPFEDFRKEFGNFINFGVYNETYEVDSVAKNIYSILLSDNYEEMAKNAHLRTKDYTWANYVDRVFKLIETL
jgi:glycosyltransferase involved in cell wall biosynthesis